jgi:hypothetical protein
MLAKVRDTKMGVAPSLANERATAKPMPLEPPVITTRWPLSFKSMVQSFNEKILQLFNVNHTEAH